MSFTGWTPLATPLTELGAVALKGLFGSMATVGVQAAYHYFCRDCEKQLNACEHDLEKVKTRFTELTQEERDRISILVEVKGGKSLETLEKELRR